MSTLRGIQGPPIFRRVTNRGSHMRVPALPEDGVAEEYKPIAPPEWWKREQRVAELNKDYPQPSKLKVWWSWYNVPVILTFALLVLVGLFMALATSGRLEWMK